MNQAQLIKSINVGRSQLGWDEDLYRATLARFGGSADAAGRISLKSLTVLQMTQLLAHMRANGFKVQAGRPANLEARGRGELKKVEALLADAGKPWAYAEAILKTQTRGRKTRLAFADHRELAAVITALENSAIKRLHQELGAQLQAAGLSWADAGRAAELLFGFEAKRDLRRYAEAMSKVLRWLRGDLTAVSPLA